MQQNNLNNIQRPLKYILHWVRGVCCNAMHYYCMISFISHQAVPAVWHGNLASLIYGLAISTATNWRDVFEPSKTRVYVRFLDNLCGS